MKKITIKYSLFFFLFLVLLIPVSGFGQKPVSKGIIVLNDDALNQKVINLKGTWEFYNNQLYTPSDFKNKTITKPEYFPVPGLWNKVKKDKSEGGKGYGTYHLQIINTKKDKLYGINLNKVQSSYKIWINNQLLKEEGIVGKNKETSKPAWSSSDIIFKATGDTTKIVLQVSNFYHKKGGIELSPVFAEAKTLAEDGWKRVSWNIFLLGIFLIMAAYHFAAFLFRRNDKSNLYFSLTLIFSALFSITVGEILLMDLFPSLNWEILIKTNYISNYLRLLFFLLFIYYVFPKELNKQFIKILTYLVSAIVIFIIATPAIIYTQTLIVFLIITGVTIIYIIYGQIKAISKKRPGAIYSLIGVLFLLGTAVNDILKELQLIDTISLTIFGIFIFIILHSYLITLQNTFSYKAIKRITKNIGIRSKVKDVLFSAESYDLTAPLEVISNVIDTDRSLIFVYSQNDWLASSEYLKKTEEAKALQIKVFSNKENTYFSSLNVKKTISLKEPTYTVAGDVVKAADLKYFEEFGINSVFSYPLIKDDIVVALLYFENYKNKKNFTKLTIEILEDIKSQILVFMDNYTSYNTLKRLNLNLEKEVYNKTKEIENRTEELKILRNKLEKQNAQTFKTTQELQKQTEEINDGINYSEKIQKALLADKKNLKSFFPESFIFHQTTNKLISTFFWFHQINSNEIVYASVNSQGSNISSALISILTTQLLNDIIIYNQNYSPKIILNLIQENFEIYSEDIGSVDIAICNYNKKKSELLYSGANHSVFFSFENHLIEYKSSEEPLKGKSDNNNTKRFFSNKRINIKEKTSIFLCAGDIKCNKKNSEKGLIQKKELISKLVNISDYNSETLPEVFNNFFPDTQKEDILITGIKF